MHNSPRSHRSRWIRLAGDLLCASWDNLLDALRWGIKEWICRLKSDMKSSVVLSISIRVFLFFSFLFSDPVFLSFWTIIHYLYTECSIYFYSKKFVRNGSIASTPGQASHCVKIQSSDGFSHNMTWNRSRYFYRLKYQFHILVIGAHTKWMCSSRSG